METNNQLPLMLLAAVASFSMIVFTGLWLSSYYPAKPGIELIITCLSLPLSWPVLFITLNLIRFYWRGIFILSTLLLIFLVPIIHFSFHSAPVVH